MKLELGGGDEPLEGFTNMDAYARQNVHIVHDATKPWPIESESVEEVYSREFIEHIRWTEIDKVLSEAFRVLKPGGRFAFSCPDFEGITKHIFTATPEQVFYMRRGILGDGSMEFDFHRNVLWFGYAKELMEKAGFVNIRRFEPTETFMQSIKLCVEAYKP